MVMGLDRFRAHFAGCEHQYVLVGGTASELVLNEAGLPFRLTKDLDIVLIVEALDAAFSERFMAFVTDGGYQVQERASGERVLYRFQKPSQAGYPAMIELFSRTPEGIVLAQDSAVTPLPIDEAAASLSAILLNADYYDFLKAMRRTVQDVPILEEAAIIPFKARAWIDLTARRAAGEEGQGDNIKKHRNDVARLLQLLPAGTSIALPDTIRTDMRAFAAAVAADEAFDPRQFKIDITREALIERLSAAYGL